jgi:choline-sulfatase
VALAGCRGERPAQPPAASARPSILVVTLDTTRADSIGPEAIGVSTPAFDAIASRGRWFRQAYATAPETLPSHASMMTGLYPAGHGVHENARALPEGHVLAAERLKQAGYATAAFVSSFVLARQFGLARGFDVYDDARPAGGVERSAGDTTERAIAHLGQAAAGTPLFIWVHYFDPHAPYDPPEPLRSRLGAQSARGRYLGEIAAMDEQLGRLLQAFEQHASRRGVPAAIVVAADHGEGLGDHGESTHGNLLYQSTMHVPMAMAGPGVPPDVVDAPVSTRRIFHTLLDWAGLGGDQSLRGESREVVLGEAMKPYLEYGWQPQIMAVEGRHKAIFAGRTELFDVLADPGEVRNLGAGGNLPSSIRKALDDYPVPTPGQAASPANLSAEARRNLASLGYVSATAAPVVRRDAPRPVDMVGLFDDIERASTLFVREQYAEAIPVLQRILAKDSHNLDAALRLATAYSSLGRNAQAVEAFRRASAIAPQSADVRLYLALHYARTDEWERALPMLERLVAEMPDRVPAWQTLGELAMGAGRTETAIAAFERTRALLGPGFRHDLELGVLYLAARRLQESRQSLDRVLASQPSHPMALFKRAQVSALLNEPDLRRRIDLARRHADATTRPLIARERLFQD